MNIVFLIGNGFDLKLGLKTRYSQFYEWYKDRDLTGNPAVDTFRNTIDVKSDYWADLEKALGTYLRKVTSRQEALDIIKDVRKNLREYIAEQNQKIELKNESDNFKFIHHFFNPSLVFRPQTKRSINDRYPFQGQNVESRIILFNYTNTLERILGWEGKVLRYTLGDGRSKNIVDIEHVHGYCDDRGRMALGVDSAEQIDNPDLIEDEELIEWLVKPAFNDTYELEHHVKCFNWITCADVIVVYGLSLGETDQTWWNAIATRMMNNEYTILIVHFKHNCTYEQDGGPVCRQQLREDKGKIIKRLKFEERLNLKEDSATDSKALKQIKDRIFPTFSEELFAIPKNK